MALLSLNCPDDGGEILMDVRDGEEDWESCTCGVMAHWTPDGTIVWDTSHKRRVDDALGPA